MVSPKNIVISAQAFPPRTGGKQSLMEGLAAHASAAGAQVNVYTDLKKGDDAYDSAQNKPYQIKRFGGIKPLRQRRVARAVASYAGQNETASIFCDSWRSAEHLPKALDCAVIVYAHGNEYPRGGEADYEAKRARISKALSKVDALIAVSHNTKDRAAPFIPQSCRAEVIHNPIPPAAQASVQEKAYAQALWPRPDKTRCLVLCRLVPLKGVDRAIEAVAAREDCQLVIAGEGEDTVRLRALVVSLGVQDRIIFAGRVEGGGKSALFASADIFMQPGRNVGGHYEGYGLTYLEAGLHGLPSISGDQGGAPEAVLDGQTGLVIDASSQEAVSRALGRLVEDAPLRQKLGEAAKRHALTQLWPKKIDSILGQGRLSQEAAAASLALARAGNYVEDDSAAVSTLIKDKRHD